jgi:hypothetical protein
MYSERVRSAWSTGGFHRISLDTDTVISHYCLQRGHSNHRCPLFQPSDWLFVNRTSHPLIPSFNHFISSLSGDPKFESLWFLSGFLLRKSKKCLIHWWLPSYFSRYRYSNKSWMRNGPKRTYDKWGVAISCWNIPLEQMVVRDVQNTFPFCFRISKNLTLSFKFHKIIFTLDI